MKNWPFALWGGDGSGDDDGVEDDGDEPDTSTTLTMTQADLEKTIARAASRASRKATKDLTKTLGFESKDELTAFVSEVRNSEEENQDAVAKRSKELEEERSALASTRKQALNERIDLTVDRAIILSGITDEAKVKRIRTLVRSELDPDVDIEGLADEVATAMETVKADVPSMFEVKSPKNPGSGDGGASDNPPSDEQKRKDLEKQYQDEYRNRGLVVTTPN